MTYTQEMLSFYKHYFSNQSFYKRKNIDVLNWKTIKDNCNISQIYCVFQKQLWQYHTTGFVAQKRAKAFRKNQKNRVYKLLGMFSNKLEAKVKAYTLEIRRGTKIKRRFEKKPTFKITKRDFKNLSLRFLAVIWYSKIVKKKVFSNFVNFKPLKIYYFNKSKKNLFFKIKTTKFIKANKFPTKSKNTAKYKLSNIPVKKQYPIKFILTKSKILFKKATSNKKKMVRKNELLALSFGAPKKSKNFFLRFKRTNLNLFWKLSEYVAAIYLQKQFLKLYKAHFFFSLQQNLHRILSTKYILSKNKHFDRFVFFRKYKKIRLWKTYLRTSIGFFKYQKLNLVKNIMHDVFAESYKKQRILFEFFKSLMDASVTNNVQATEFHVRGKINARTRSKKKRMGSYFGAPTRIGFSQYDRRILTEDTKSDARTGSFFLKLFVSYKYNTENTQVTR